MAIGRRFGLVQESTPAEVTVFQQEPDQKWIFFLKTGLEAGEE